MQRSVLLVPILLLLAGCVNPPASDTTDAAAETAGGWVLPFPDPMGQEHDHGDIEAHAHAWQFEQTAHHPLAGSATHGSGAHALDARNGWLFAAVYGGEADAEGGFFVFDVSDPASPKETGRFRFAGPMGGDRSMEATDDADFVVLGTEAIDCAGHVNPFAPGLYLIDVRDKAMPVIAHYVQDTGVHSVSVHRIGDEDYVFGLMSGDSNIFRIVRDPVPMLEPVAFVPIGHDSIVMDDPLLGKPVLYAANGGGDFVIWDVSDPANPQQLGEWAIPDRDDKFYVHTGAVQIIGDRRIAVVSSEDWEDYPSQLWVLDATDLGYIETLSTWHAPGAHAADGLRYSMHNPRFLGDTLVIAYYHGGVWALDLSTPEKQRAPEVVGQFMPGTSNGWTPERPKTSAVADNLCGVFNMADAPFAFDVEAYEGVVYVADMPTGLYTIKPTWA